MIVLSFVCEHIYAYDGLQYIYYEEEEEEGGCFGYGQDAMNGDCRI